MQHTNKGNHCYLGMKLHTGADKNLGLIHPVAVTAVNAHVLRRAADLLHCDEQVVYGDAGYQGNTKTPEMKRTKVEFRVAMRPGKRRALPVTRDG